MNVSGTYAGWTRLAGPGPGLARLSRRCAGVFDGPADGRGDVELLRVLGREKFAQLRGAN